MSKQPINSLRILFTNNALGTPGGTETYVKDACRGLLRRGHTPIVYSAAHGSISSELMKMGVTVLDTLELMNTPPDIIHGHHHLDTTHAILIYPNTPCINFCHGITPWEEMPAAKLSNIIRYVAISDVTRAHLISNGVRPEKITILPNFVDETRFTPFRESGHFNQQDLEAGASKCIKALVFGNYKCKYHDVIEAACESEGVQLDAIGAPWQNNILNPESIIPEYDIVFCYGKSAMESLYCGCHVILYHTEGIGPAVSQVNFEELRRRNFGFHTCNDIPEMNNLRGKLSKIRAERQLHSKSPITAEQRNSLGSGRSIDSLIDIYNETISNWSPSESAIKHSDLDRIELARYIQFLQKSRLSQKIDFNPIESRTIKEYDMRTSELMRNNDGLSAVNLKLKLELAQAQEEMAKAKHVLAEAHENSRQLAIQHKGIYKIIRIASSSTKKATALIARFATYNEKMYSDGLILRKLLIVPHNYSASTKLLAIKPAQKRGLNN